MRCAFADLRAVRVAVDQELADLARAARPACARWRSSRR